MKKKAPPATKEKATALKTKAKAKTPPASKGKATTKQPATKKTKTPWNHLEAAGKPNNQTTSARRGRDKRARELHKKQHHRSELQQSGGEEANGEEQNNKVQQLIHETERHRMGDAHRRNHRNGIKQMIQFWKESDKMPNRCVEKVVRKVPIGE